MLGYARFDVAIQLNCGGRANPTYELRAYQTTMTRATRNILFIMCDQLRWDYLSCYGHPRLATPHIDALAARGVRFTRAYVQSPVCGASRMSFYTGRYVQSHGATWNGVPLKVGEMTLGDYLRPLGVDAVLVGKTHMRADREGMERLGIDPSSIIGVRVAECGFDPYERDDGLHGLGPDGRYEPQNPRYNSYLNDKGYAGDNPWHDWANAAQGEGNKLSSGWAMRHARKPARVAEEDSETPYMTRRAMDFMARGRRAALVPAPLLHQAALALHRASALQRHVRGRRRAARRALAGGAQGPAPDLRRVHGPAREPDVRAAGGARGGDPRLHGAHQADRRSAGRCCSASCEDRGLLESTLIVFTSDHGDYLGDHWLGEKDLFHEPSVKVPLIICDPSAEADPARGTVCDDLVEAIDLVPTFLEALGADAAQQSHRLEGRSLLPFLRGQPPARWRRYAISEYDYAMLPVAAKLGIEPRDARLFMVADRRWKLIHAPGFRPMLYDLEADPNEYRDLGADPACEGERRRLMAALNAWGLRLSQRTTLSEQQVRNRRGKSQRLGILIGVWDESELPDELWSKYLGEGQ